jgi:predicted nucleotidyltransferase
LLSVTTYRIRQGWIEPHLKQGQEIIMASIFNEDFRDFIKALNDAEVAYILVGGYSVILHGYARTTGDLDIWVQRTSVNYKKLKFAFLKFGMPVFDMTEDNFLYHENWDVFTFGLPPVAIDIMVSVKGISFDSAFQNSLEINEDGLPVRLIHLSDLIVAKKAANRPKDQDDLQNLQ